MKIWLERVGKGAIWGTEIAPETKKLHFQGYFELKAKKGYLWSALCKKWPNTNFLKARGDGLANIDYCSKDATDVYRTLEKTSKEKQNEQHERYVRYWESVQWRPWQKKVIDIVTGPHQDRKIHWYYDEKGNRGKSMIAQYLQFKYDAIVCDGKADNVKNQVIKWKENNEGEDVKVVVMDITRKYMEYVNYSLLEQLKNGFFYSGKYEGGVFNQARDVSMHVIIFANSKPEEGAWTADRYDIYDMSELDNFNNSVIDF